MVCEGDAALATLSSMSLHLHPPPGGVGEVPGGARGADVGRSSSL